MKKTIFTALSVLLFSNFTFANNVNECENGAKTITFEFEQEVFMITNTTSCYDVFAAAYNAWISLGHSAEVAHTRATRTLNACLDANQPNPDPNP
jgi:hypothetical protein